MVSALSPSVQYSTVINEGPVNNEIFIKVILMQFKTI